MIVGIVGLGRMGTVFATRLLERRFQVGVWNRTRAKTDACAALGATVYDTPRLLGASSDVILVSLADETALRDAYTGPDGLLAAPLGGKTIAEMSTVRPSFVRQLAENVQAAAGRFIDAPVLGTVAPAREGKLVVLAGGHVEALERLRPVLGVLSRRIVHMGPVGAGATMKLVVNAQLATYWQCLGESLALGKRSGIGVAQMLDVLSDSPIATGALAAKLPILQGARAEVAFSLAGARKDLFSAISAAEAVGVRAHAAAGALAGYDLAIESGRAQADVAEIVLFNLEHARGLEAGSRSAGQGSVEP